MANTNGNPGLFLHSCSKFRPCSVSHRNVHSSLRCCRDHMMWLQFLLDWCIHVCFAAGVASCHECTGLAVCHVRHDSVWPLGSRSFGCISYFFELLSDASQCSSHCAIQTSAGLPSRGCCLPANISWPIILQTFEILPAKTQRIPVHPSSDQTFLFKS